MEDILLRLDFENSKAIQSEIIILIFRMFWHKQLEGSDYLKRIKRIKYMIKISRLASLHFHRFVFSLKLITVEDAGRFLIFLFFITSLIFFLFFLILKINF